MAGIGKRLRPHTLTTPKPLIPIAGKTIVERLIDELVNVCKQNVENIGFIIGNFGEIIENQLLELANKYNANGKIYYQNEPLGTAHAVYCAEELLKNETIIAFADTIFYADFNLNTNTDAIIWVKEVDDPSAFGVVKVNENNIITDFIEKSKEFVSNKAIIGVYYFKNSEMLRNEIKFILDNNLRGNNEYQLTDALENMKNKGFVFSPAVVDEWLDCGNKDATLYTNSKVLQRNTENVISLNVKIINSLIIPPCYIGEDSIIENSVLGPNVSVEQNSSIKNSVISDSIILSNSELFNQNFNNSFIGNNVNLKSHPIELNIGDFNFIA